MRKIGAMILSGGLLILGGLACDSRPASSANQGGATVSSAGTAAEETKRARELVQAWATSGDYWRGVELLNQLKLMGQPALPALEEFRKKTGAWMRRVQSNQRLAMTSPGEHYQAVTAYRDLGEFIDAAVRELETKKKP